MRRGIGGVLAVFAVLTSGLADSDSFDLSLPDLVALADRIAWIQIDGSEEIRVDSETGGYTCGYVYRATVVRAIKGANLPFRFFSAYDWTQDGGIRDYLVLANKRSPRGSQLVRDRITRTLDTAAAERILCGVDAAEYHSQIAPRELMIKLVRIDGGQSEPFGLSTDKNLLGRPEFQQETVRLGSRTVSVVSWTRIERTIRQALD